MTVDRYDIQKGMFVAGPEYRPRTMPKSACESRFSKTLR
jgi:hypothetical protein